jgi:hypothetical protein
MAAPTYSRNPIYLFARGYRAVSPEKHAPAFI